jgi:hypothetical protein
MLSNALLSSLLVFSNLFLTLDLEYIMYVHTYIYLHVITACFSVSAYYYLLLIIYYLLLCHVASSSLGREPAVKYVHMYIHMGNICLLGLGLGEDVQNTE